MTESPGCFVDNSFHMDSTSEMTPETTSPWSDHDLIVAIDYGYKHLRVAYQIVPPGAKPNIENVAILSLDPKRQVKFLEQTVAWVVQDGIEDKLLYGADAQKQHDRRAGSKRVVVVEQPKNMLFLADQGKDWMQEKKDHMAAVLGKSGKDIFDTVSTHLWLIRGDIKRAIKRAKRMSDLDFDRMRMHTICTAPESASPGGLALLRQVMQEAKFENTTLKSETEAVAAFHFYSNKDSSRHGIDDRPQDTLVSRFRAQLSQLLMVETANALHSST